MSPPSANISHLDTPFFVAELKAALASVQKAFSPGPDGISHMVLSHLGANVKRWLLSVFNHSWETGHLEPEWKCARIVPVLKPSKMPMHTDSYWPIALLSCISKLMEKMVLHCLDCSH